MSIVTYPCHEQSALILAGGLCACIVASYMQKNGAMPKEDEERFLADPKDFIRNAMLGLTAYDESGNTYMEETEADRILDEANVSHTYLMEFTGEITYSMNGITIPYENEFLCFLAPQREPDLFHAAYEYPAELENEYYQVLKDVIPDWFDLEPYIGNILGVYDA